FLSFFYSSLALRDLHSFPTRRSSDLEPVLGEGGFVVPPRDYFKLLQNICRKHGILFIADEVQSGFARTGKWFASEHFGIEPDLRSEEHTSELQSRSDLVCRLLLEKKK